MAITQIQCDDVAEWLRAKEPYSFVAYVRSNYDNATVTEIDRRLFGCFLEFRIHLMLMLN
jgi:hypothetical protein